MIDVTKGMAIAVALTMAPGALAGKSQVMAGRIACDQGDWEAAVEKTTDGLADLAGVKTNLQIRGWLCQARAYNELAVEAADKYPDGALKADAALKNAAAVDDPKQMAKSRHEIDRLGEAIGATAHNVGAIAYNAGELERAEAHFSVASERRPADPVAPMMIGFVRYQHGDIDGAIALFRTARERFEAAGGDNPDMAQGYTTLALLLLQKEAAAAEILEVIEAGLQRFPDNRDLVATRLAVYQRDPSLYAEARREFEAAIAAQPDDVNLQLAWAQIMVANGDADEAEDLFVAVLAKDPKNLAANANAAALHVNRAATLNEQLVGGEDRELRNRVIAEMRAAHPYLLAAHEADPTNPEWVSHLVNVCLAVPELEKDAPRWLEKKKAMSAP